MSSHSVLPRAGAALLALALAAGALAAPPQLTLAEAQRLALQRSRQLAGADLEADAARQLAVVAGQLPDPVLKAGIDNLPVSGADRFSTGADFMTMRRVGVSQELTSADKRRLRAAAYTLEAERSEAAKTAAAAAIERDTALAWLDYYFARQSAELVAEQEVQAGDAVEAAAGAYRAGRGSQADWLAARAALVAVQDRASESARRVRSAATMLARWTGIATAPELAAPPAMDAIQLDSAALQSQLAHHPEIAVLARQEQIAQAAVQLAEADRKPDWSVELAFQQRGSAYSNMISVGVSVPLQWDRKDRQDRTLAARISQAGQARAQREEMLRAHVADTESLIAEWQNGRERAARYRQELLPLAHERSAAAAAAYRGGKASLAELLAARGSELDARLQALQLQADTARLWARLNFLFPSELANLRAAAIHKESP